MSYRYLLGIERDDGTTHIYIAYGERERVYVRDTETGEILECDFPHSVRDVPAYKDWPVLLNYARNEIIGSAMEGWDVL
jgi:hypothetical protein